MLFIQPGWVRDILLRAAGLVLWACSGLIASLLYNHFGTAHRDPALLEFLAGIVGFSCFSAGNFLVILGEHIFDRVEVSERWRRRSCPPAGRMVDR